MPNQNGLMNSQCPLSDAKPIGLRFEPGQDHVNRVRIRSSSNTESFRKLLPEFRRAFLGESDDRAGRFVRRRGFELKCIFSDQVFLKKWANPGHIFVYFRPFLLATTITPIKNEESVDVLLGFRGW